VIKEDPVGDKGRPAGGLNVPELTVKSKALEGAIATECSRVLVLLGGAKHKLFAAARSDIERITAEANRMTTSGAITKTNHRDERAKYQEIENQFQVVVAQLAVASDALVKVDTSAKAGIDVIADLRSETESLLQAAKSQFAQTSLKWSQALGGSIVLHVPKPEDSGPAAPFAESDRKHRLFPAGFGNPRKPTTPTRRRSVHLPDLA
jgi:hypothetical protein